jgi:hypothetical protein
MADLTIREFISKWRLVEPKERLMALLTIVLSRIAIDVNTSN